MKLRDYKDKYSLNLHELARLCGLNGEHANSRMCRYVSGKRMPPGIIARQIVKATKGEVGWDDFYDTPSKGEV